MAFIRLSDNYIDNPKFTALSDGAFRLWHEALAFCRRHETDGTIPKASMVKFPAYSVKRLHELVTPWQATANPLLRNSGAVYDVHDYLLWNASKAEAQAEKAGAAKRMQAFRRRTRDSVTSSVTDTVTRSVTNGEVPDTDTDTDTDTDRKRSSERESERKPITSLVPDDLADRAGQLLQRYSDLYTKHRHGARLRLIGNSVEWQEACSLVALWDDARLDQLAEIVLKTEDSFIAGTDRSFKIFALKASWADGRLAEVRAGHA